MKIILFLDVPILRHFTVTQKLMQKGKSIIIINSLIFTTVSRDKSIMILESDPRPIQMNKDKVFLLFCLNIWVNVFFYVRPGHGEPCAGATNVLFDQVGSKRAVFRQEGAGKYY